LSTAGGAGVRLVEDSDPDLTDGERLHAAHCATWARFCDAMEGARFERRSGYAWTICPPVPIPSFNSVWPEDDAAAGALEGALSEIAAAALPYSLHARRGKTPAWEEEAERLGLMVRDEEPAMLVTADDLREVDVPEVEIVQVKTADGLAQALAVAAEGFGVPPDLFAPLYDLELLELDGLPYYLGRVGDTDVTTGTAFTVGNAVGVLSVATPLQHRGRGYGAAVTSQAVREGFRAGAEFAWLHSSPSGYPVYHRLGFRTVERYVLYAAPEAAPEAPDARV
jgi:ribosomal protein S18 acetylase RimI-like enzyme